MKTTRNIFSGLAVVCLLIGYLVQSEIAMFLYVTAAFIALVLAVICLCKGIWVKEGRATLIIAFLFFVPSGFWAYNYMALDTDEHVVINGVRQ
jgi:hypothetical protein